MKTVLILLIFFQTIFFVNAQTIKDSVKHFTANDAGEQIAITELINNYSRYADRREPQKQANLFTEDATIEIYHSEPGNNKPDTILRGRKEFITGFGTLKNYDVTMHFNGQSTIHINGNNATGETYCLAHHIWMENGKRMLMVMGIRYYDTFIYTNNQWFFAKRKLIFDWVDKRPSTP